MLESSSENNDRMIICDRLQTRVPPARKWGRRLIFSCQLLYRNSKVGRLPCVLYPPDKLVIADIIHSDVIHTLPSYLGQLF
jgi:hypothetical protein